MIDTLKSIDIESFNINRAEDLLTDSPLPYVDFLCQGSFVRIYSLCIDSFDGLIPDSSFSLLSSAEILRFRSFSHIQSSHSFLLGRLLIRHAISWICNVDIPTVSIVQASPFSKPTSPLVFFTLSHSRSALVGAFCRDFDCGVDVEYAEDSIDFESIVDICFPLELSRWFYQQPIDLRLASFYRAWTYLESVGKLYGLGLSSLSIGSDRVMSFGLRFEATNYVGHLSLLPF